MLVGADGTANSEVFPATNTRLFAVQEGCDESFESPSVVLNVRAALSISAKRIGTRAYTFSGDSLPARPGGLEVSLYRVERDGRHVLTAQTRADARTGNYSLTRRFTGSGELAFVVRTGQDLRNAAGSSNVRPTVVY